MFFFMNLFSLSNIIPGSLPDDASSSSSNFQVLTQSDCIFQLHSQEHVISPILPLRKSTRIHNKPSWMQDFVVNYLSTASNFDLSVYFTPSHHTYLNTISHIHKPCTYTQASSDPNWVAAKHH